MQQVCSYFIISRLNFSSDIGVFTLNGCAQGESTYILLGSKYTGFPATSAFCASLLVTFFNIRFLSISSIVKHLGGKRVALDFMLPFLSNSRCLNILLMQYIVITGLRYRYSERLQFHRHRPHQFRWSS